MIERKKCLRLYSLLSFETGLFQCGRQSISRLFTIQRAIRYHIHQVDSFSLVELVEAKISREMKNTNGAVVHDGWTDCEMHYLGIFAVYTRRVRSVLNYSEVYHNEVINVLLSMSPMYMLCTCTIYNYECTTETRFYAKTNCVTFREVFHMFRIDFDDWTAFQVSLND